MLNSSPNRNQTLLAALVLAGVMVPARASADDIDARPAAGTREIGARVGVGLVATTALGGLTAEEANGRSGLIVAARAGWVVATNESLALEYTVEVVPVEIASHTLVGPRDSPRRASVYGAGISPLGLAVVTKHGRFRPFLGLSGGIVAFTDVVPLPGTRELDFTADVVGGATIERQGRRALVVGLNLHHVSNGGRSSPNRGLNALVLFVGGRVFR